MKSKRFIVLTIVLAAAFAAIPVFADTSATGQFQFQPIVSIPLPMGSNASGAVLNGNSLRIIFTAKNG